MHNYLDADLEDCLRNSYRSPAPFIQTEVTQFALGDSDQKQNTLKNVLANINRRQDIGIPRSKLLEQKSMPELIDRALLVPLSAEPLVSDEELLNCLSPKSL